MNEWLNASDTKRKHKSVCLSRWKALRGTTKLNPLSLGLANVLDISLSSILIDWSTMQRRTDVQPIQDLQKLLKNEPSSKPSNLCRLKKGYKNEWECWTKKESLLEPGNEQPLSGLYNPGWLYAARVIRA